MNKWNISVNSSFQLKKSSKKITHIVSLEPAARKCSEKNASETQLLIVKVEILV